jgi:MiaB-like tRNA modifying enzyme
MKTYGCTLNQADSDIMSSILSENGAEITGDIANADVAVINTCTVKKGTERKILHRLADLELKKKPMLVTGCMAGANRDLIERFAPSASIMTIQNIPLIVDAVYSVRSGKRTVLASRQGNERLDYFGHAGKTIAKIPVSDGCLGACTFCETKAARGPLHSFDEQTILKAVRKSVDGGAKEIQLTSQDMGAYGKDKKTDLAELLDKISEIEGHFKVRVGMLNPEHLDGLVDRLAEILNGDRFYKFVHLPLEAGSDRVLMEMGRNYTRGEYEGHVKELRALVKGITIETDIMVGFPGESDDDFVASEEIIERLKFEVTNISRFGARPHAPASKMTQLPVGTVNRRSGELSRLVRRTQKETNEKYIGRKVDTLFTEMSKGSINGRTGAYRQVVLRNCDGNAKIGEAKKLTISEVSANVLYGRVAG